MEVVVQSGNLAQVHQEGRLVLSREVSRHPPILHLYPHLVRPNRNPVRQAQYELTVVAVIPEVTVNPNEPAPKTYRIRLVPHLVDNARSLHFDPVIRELLPIAVAAGQMPSSAAASVTSVGPLVNGKAPAILLKIGRFTDRAGVGGASDLSENRIAFKSKVVSRSHAEIWCEPNGKVSSVIRTRCGADDTSSSFGMLRVALGHFSTIYDYLVPISIHDRLS